MLKESNNAFICALILTYQKYLNILKDDILSIIILKLTLKIPLIICHILVNKFIFN